jgi:hypothetical protein
MEGFINDLLVFCESASGVAKTPAAGDLFEVNTKSVMLSEEKKQFFHSAVAKFLYLGKRVRPDLYQCQKKCYCTTNGRRNNRNLK